MFSYKIHSITFLLEKFLKVLGLAKAEDWCRLQETKIPMPELKPVFEKNGAQTTTATTSHDDLHDAQNVDVVAQTAVRRAVRRFTEVSTFSRVGVFYCSELLEFLIHLDFCFPFAFWLQSSLSITKSTSVDHFIHWVFDGTLIHLQRPDLSTKCWHIGTSVAIYSLFKVY